MRPIYFLASLASVAGFASSPAEEPPSPSPISPPGSPSPSPISPPGSPSQPCVTNATTCVEPDATTSAPYGGFVVGASPLTYENGGHRRPTDPATQEEVRAVQTLLFGTSAVKSLDAADTLAAAPNGWSLIESALAEIGGVDPATIRGVAEIEECPNGTLGSAEAKLAYNELVSTAGAASAYEMTKADGKLRCNLVLWSVERVATIVPDREHVLAVDAAIEGGQTDYALKKIVAARLKGGTETVVDGIRWTNTISVAVDVTDTAAPVVVPDYLELYLAANRVMPTPTLADIDGAYLKAATMAIFGKYTTIHFATGSSIGAGASVKQFAQPYHWAHGDSALFYGNQSNSYLVQDWMRPLQETVLPIDFFTTVSAGTLMGPYPITVLYEIDAFGTTIPSPENTLVDSPAIGLAWYGRCLRFSAEDAAILRASIDTGFPGFGTDWATVTPIFSAAIAAAWGEEEITPSSHFYPGQLVTDADGLPRPKSAVNHKQDTGTYVNHATPTSYSSETITDPYTGASNLPPNTMDWSNGIFRDVRNNLDKMAPPTDANGEGIFKPNGKPKV